MTRRLLQILLLTLSIAGAASAMDIPVPVIAPEIDPGTAVAALGLLAGGLLVVRSRRKR